MDLDLILTYTIHIQQLISIDKFGIGIYTPFKSAPSVWGVLCAPCKS